VGLCTKDDGTVVREPPAKPSKPAASASGTGKLSFTPEPATRLELRSSDFTPGSFDFSKTLFDGTSLCRPTLHDCHLGTDLVAEANPRFLLGRLTAFEWTFQPFVLRGCRR
jgi:hypothetical protein